MDFNASVDLCKGFESIVFDSQYTFRKILKSMSMPGKIESFELELYPPYPLYPSTGAAVLSLFGPDTIFFSDHESDEIDSWIKFHCGSKPETEKRKSDFALITSHNDLDINSFCPGSLKRPDISTTFIVQVKNLTNNSDKNSIKLKGPGIKDYSILQIAGFDQGILEQRNKYKFPCGFDFIFCSPEGFACIPRTTSIEGF